MKAVRWGFGALAVLPVAAAALALTGRASVESAVTIAAPPEEVWAILVDTEAFPAWNPTFQVEAGRLVEGETVAYQFTDAAGATYRIEAEVRRVNPPIHLNQGGGQPGVITFDHHYRLEPDGAGTRLVIEETYRGAMVHFWDPASVGEAYRRLGEALKARVEGG